MKVLTKRLCAWITARWVETEPRSRLFRGVHRVIDFKIDDVVSEGVPFWPLTPIEDSCANPRGKEYFSKAMRDPRVKNIAVAGPYGSGKSSFLRTYFKGRNILWVSLASFTERMRGGRDGEFKEKKGCHRGINVLKYEDARREHLNRILEISVLQQIFYAARNSELPMTRFWRIGRIGIWRYVRAAFLMLVCAGFSFLIWAKGSVVKNFTVPADLNILEDWRWWVFLAAIMIVTLVAMMLYELLCHSRVVCKLNVKDVDIAFNKGGNESIFNKMLDEVIYNFQVLKYEAVIFEDIDRFDDPLIFVKLRELNQILNATRQIGWTRKPIRFIYAVRDTLFSSEHRVKFFDFILPILPVVNAANSRAVFEARLKEGLNVVVLPQRFRDFAKTISPFLCDMRLINNICTEFFALKDCFVNGLSDVKLLGMMVFKNVFPSAFDTLFNSNGVLRRIMNAKGRVVTMQKQAEDASFAERIAQYEQQEITDVGAAKKILLNEYLAAFMKYAIEHRIEGINIDDNHYTVTHFCEADRFELLIDREFVLTYKNYDYYQTPKRFSWADIEALVGKEPYKSRVELIEKNSKSVRDEMRANHERRIREIEDMKDLPVSALLKSGAYDRKLLRTILSQDKDVSYGDHEVGLLYALLKFGYITERYRYYASIFHEGVLDRYEFEFVVMVLTGEKTDAELHINHVPEVLETIDDACYGTKSILNYDLMDEIVTSHTVREEQKLAISKMLLLDDNDVLDFIEGWILRRQKKSTALDCIFKFLEERCGGWMYRMINRATEDEKGKRIIVGAYIRAQVDQNEKYILPDFLKDFIQNVSNLSLLVDDMGMSIKFIGALIRKNGIRFKNFVVSDAVQDGMMEMVYSMSAYAFTYEIIKGILEWLGKDTTAFATANYTCINESGATELVECINAGMDLYIGEMYRNLEESQSEKSESLLEMLNCKKLNEEDVRVVARKQRRNVLDLDKIKYHDVMQVLLEERKFVFKWENVFKMYDWIKSFDNTGNGENEDYGFVIDEVHDYELLRVFVCENAYALSHREIGNYESKWESDFVHRLMMDANVENNALSMLLGRLPVERFGHVELTDELSAERVRIIAQFGYVPFSEDAYMRLSLLGNGAHLALAKYYIDGFIGAVDRMDVTDDDLVRLLRECQNEDKRIALCERIVHRIRPETELAQEVARGISVGNCHRYPPSILAAVFKLLFPPVLQCDAIIVMAKGQEETIEMIREMPPPYSNLARPGRNVKLPREEHAARLVQYLKTVNIVSSVWETNSELIVRNKYFHPRQ